MNDASGHRLLLVRHAKSDYPLGVADHDRPLNERGRRDAPFIGSWIAKNVTLASGERPLILVSSANRAQLTWARATNGLADGWLDADVRTEPRIYEAGLTTLLDIVGALPEDVSTAVIVGHNPTLCDFVARTCVEVALQLEATAKFPTSSVAVLETGLAWADAPWSVRGFRVSAFTVPRG
ncbi:MAG: histidine phosphatase family protein [Actinomycetes bacterium]